MLIPTALPLSSTDKSTFNMVSFKSIVMLSLIAAVQVANSSPIEERAVGTYPRCSEIYDLSLSNTKDLDHLTVDENSQPTRLTNDPALKNQTTISVLLEKTSKSHGRYITTVKTGHVVGNTERVLRIDWLRQKGGVQTSRYFYLTSNKKCRVANSADYYDLLNGVYVEEE